MTEPTSLSPSSTRGIWLVLLACLVAYGVGSIRTGFMGKDELRYAQVAKEMDSLPNLFVLHYQGLLYPDKPPLYFWMARTAFGLTGGVSPWGIRAPVILCTLLTVLLTWDIGRRLLGPRAALIGAAAYGLSFRTIWSAHSARLDPPLVLFTTLALWFAVRSLPRRNEGLRPALPDVIGFWAAMALGFLVKGPLGFVVPGGVFLTYACVCRRWRNLVGWTTCLGLGTFLGILGGLWILPGLHFGGWGDYFGIVWDQEVVGRSTKPWRHIKHGIVNWLYYFGRLVPEFLPGSLLLPGALVLAWKRRCAKGREWSGFLFILCWFLFVFIFFTLMKSKRGQYILPLYPAAGLLVGWFADRCLSGQAMSRRWTSIPAGFLAFVAGLVGLVAQFPFRAFEKEFQIPLPFHARLVLLAVTAALCFLMVSAIRQRNLVRQGIVGLAIVPAIVVTGFLLLYPRAHSSESARSLARFVDMQVEPGAIVLTARSKVQPRWNIWGRYFLREIDDESVLDLLGVVREDTGEMKKADRKAAHKRLAYRAFSAFSEHPEPLLLLVEEEHLTEILEEHPGFRTRNLGVFPVADGNDEDIVCVLANEAFVRRRNAATESVP